MELFIWGAGEKGRRIYEHLEPEDVVAFVDSDIGKSGHEFLGKKIISVEEYIENYSNYYIVIAHPDEPDAVELLESRNIVNYFRFSDCPGEFQEPNSRKHLKIYMENILNDRKDYALYGINLYSILIDRWIYDKYGIHPPIVPQDGMREQELVLLSSNFNGLAIINLNDLKSKGIEEIDAVIQSIPSGLKERLKMQYRLVDVYDCSTKIPAYKNIGIETFKNKHLDRRCFIVATGPSLTMNDLGVLENNREITFSVNKIFNAFKETTWRPIYYVSDYYRFVKNNSDDIDAIDCEAKFIGDTDKTFWEKEHDRNVYKFHKHYEYYFDRGPKFSDDFSQRSYTGLTVTYSCIQLAVYMGFKEIYLLGVDCNYIMGSDSNYFFSNEKKDFEDHQIDKTILAYQSAKQYADKHNIKIYNATRGGKLEVFERVDFDSLF